MPTEHVDSNNPLPLYFQIYKSLLERIQRGEFRPGSFLPPERQLTEDYGVSRITIIKALNELAQEHYIQRQQGRGTLVIDPATHSPRSERGSQQRRALAFICQTLDHPYLFQILLGVARTAARQHYNLQVISSYDTDDEDAQHIQEATSRNVDGILVYPHHGYQHEKLYRELQERNFPLVMVDRYYPRIETDCVIFDDEVAGYELAQHLLHKGCRRIAVISYFEVEATSINARLRGYRRALQEWRLPYNDNLIWLDIYSSFQRSDELSDDATSRDRLRKYITRYKPDALFTLNADVLELVINDLLILREVSLAHTDIARPRKTSLNWTGEIATFSHKPPALYTPYHSLTALHSGELLGAEATRVVIARINGTLEEKRQMIKVPMNIVASETAGQTKSLETLVRSENE